MITVFHNRNFMQYAVDNLSADDATRVLKHAVIEAVACVDTDSLEEAYRLTNNFDRPWTENDKVKAYGSKRRSTSIGDVFESPVGVYYVVEVFGYRKLSDAEVLDLTFYSPGV
jgi:hypothetical protein